MDLTQFNQENKNILDNQKQKIGRPKKQNKLNKAISIYLTDAEHQKITNLADGRPFSNFLKKIIFERLKN